MNKIWKIQTNPTKKEKGKKNKGKLKKGENYT
jgi:hypothetical protein